MKSTLLLKIFLIPIFIIVGLLLSLVVVSITNSNRESEAKSTGLESTFYETITALENRDTDVLKRNLTNQLFELYNEDSQNFAAQIPTTAKISEMAQFSNDFPDAYVVSYKYPLKGFEGFSSGEGSTTLTMAKIGGSWKIIHLNNNLDYEKVYK